MTAFLHFLLQNTLAGTVFILAVMLFRRATGNLSKLYIRVLWLITLLVLLLPPLPLGSLHTARSLIPDAQRTLLITADTQEMPQSQADIGAPTAPSAPGSPENTLSSDAGRAGGKNSSSLDKSRTPAGRTATGESGTLTGALFALWAVGALFLAAASLLQWLRLRKAVSLAVKIRPGVFRSDGIDTPFVMPGLPARIYLPLGLEKNSGQLEDILLHERRHIQNHDPLIKCAALPVLLLHWFNPFVWIAMRLMNRDMEMYCDECVLRTATIAQKQHYAQTLLDFACKRQGFLPAVYFGESSTKSRICHILNMKRPRTPIKLLLLLLILGCGLSFLITGRAQADGADGTDDLSGNTDTRPEKLLHGGTVTYRAGDATATDGAAAADGGNAVPDDGSSDAAQEGADSSSGEAPAEEEFWADQTIVGIGHPGMEPGTDVLEQMVLLDKTAHFTLYGKHDDDTDEDEDAIFVECPDGCLVYAQIPYISTYGIPPVLLENDFDGDGENELSIITYVMHGTGVSIHTLFMADHTRDGSWKLFHYRDSDYLAELMPHFDTKYEADGVHLLVDGVPTGIPEQVAQEELDNQYGYYAGSQIAFRFVEEKILLRAQLAGYSKINHVGEFPGHELDAEVRYLGEGSWRLDGIHYADAGINDLIEEAIPLYLTGQIGEVNEYYTVPGISLPDFDDPCEEVTVLSIAYAPEEVAGNAASVHVIVRRDKNASMDYFTVPVRRVALDFGGMWWRIAGKITKE